MTSAALGDAIFVKCDINQHSVNALVDTGAAVTIIQLHVLNKIRVGDYNMWSPHQPIFGTTKHSLDICGATEIKIRIENVEVQHQAYVCKDLTHELLVGAD